MKRTGDQQGRSQQPRATDILQAFLNSNSEMDTRKTTNQARKHRTTTSERGESVQAYKNTCELLLDVIEEVFDIIEEGDQETLLEKCNTFDAFDRAYRNKQ